MARCTPAAPAESLARDSPTPAPPKTDTPLLAPSANASDATDPLRYTFAAVPQNCRWRAYRCLRAVPTRLRESTYARPRDLRSAPDSAETPPPSPSDESYFRAFAVPALQSQSSCQQR